LGVAASGAYSDLDSRRDGSVSLLDLLLWSELGRGEEL